MTTPNNIAAETIMDAPDMGPIPDTVIFAPAESSRVEVLQQHSHQLPNGLRINFSVNRIVKTAVHGQRNTGERQQDHE